MAPDLMLRGLICWSAGIAIILLVLAVETGSGMTWDGRALEALFLYTILVSIYGMPCLLAGMVLIVLFDRSIASWPILWSGGFTAACLAYMRWTLHGPEVGSLVEPACGIVVAGVVMASWVRLRPIVLQKHRLPPT